MAQIPDKVSSIIDLFLEELNNNNINIEQAITADDPFVKQILATGINVMRNASGKTS